MCNTVWVRDAKRALGLRKKPVAYSDMGSSKKTVSVHIKHVSLIVIASAATTKLKYPFTSHKIDQIHLDYTKSDLVYFSTLLHHFNAPKSFLEYRKKKHTHIKLTPLKKLDLITPESLHPINYNFGAKGKMMPRCSCLRIFTGTSKIIDTQAKALQLL